MKVFLSWSGPTSKMMAEKLRDWLPAVIQCLQPWASSFDIKAGARWSREIEQELKDTKFGILCLTPSNLQADWILFEAGALAKTLDDSFVCPYLFGLTASQIPAGPLSQFQAKRTNKDDTFQLIQSINRALSDDKKLPENVLQKAFEMFWPELETFFQKLTLSEPPEEPTRTTHDMIEEILDAVRYLRRQQEPSAQFKNYLSDYLKNKYFKLEKNESSAFDISNDSRKFIFFYDTGKEDGPGRSHLNKDDDEKND